MRLLAVALLVTLIVVPSPATGPDSRREAVRLCDGRKIPFPRMIDDLKTVPAVFVGEGHTDAAHHAAQLDVILGLHARGVPVAIGLEMFYVTSQEDLDRWVAGTMSQEDFLKVWYRNWDVAWPLYRAIFVAARTYRIPLVALNLPRDLVGKVYREGFKALSPRDRESLPPGISCTIDDAYRRYVREVFSMHGSSNDRTFNNFCEAQMVWNKGMAWHLATYMKKNPTRTMVILTGTGHAMKSGIPRQLQEFLPARTKVVLPEVFGVSENPADEGDYLYLPQRGKRVHSPGTTPSPPVLRTPARPAPHEP